MTVSQSSLRSAASASFGQVLHASGPDQDREAKLALYAWLVGSWDIDVITFMEDGTTTKGGAKFMPDGCSKDAQYKMCG